MTWLWHGSPCVARLAGSARAKHSGESWPLSDLSAPFFCNYQLCNCICTDCLYLMILLLCPRCHHASHHLPSFICGWDLILSTVTRKPSHRSRLILSHCFTSRQVLST
ncbi:hypothetical protein FA95DRAFT_1142552 [Auriscalpium vulgare]|uniref:Uncharacterized protein n=1 Tax=Auriscalpium vulgare TaxID=40419 RepID=A0ACB8R4D3_9AGAM|nr:hypothetical protein FA95DRAFT_1142552 [Auriscalpium vulgare]